MKISSTLLPSAALGVAALLLLPTNQSEAFTFIGGSLNTGQRDFKVHNTFADSQANNNTTEDPNWPGHTGAVLALWKGAAEWNSDPHGDGSGDPLQTNVGSGGADFDFAFVGEASTIGGSNANTMGVLSGSNGGVLAFMDPGFGGISDGWNIRFYDGGITWHDGPSIINNGGFDLQAVACHELGHALGLGHSSTSFNNTMFPSIGNGSEGERSIAADDIAGVQSRYSAKDASKPTITSANVAGGQITVNGFNFAASNNELWFSREGLTNSGSMLVLNGLNSTTGGTQIIASIPSGAGAGAVHVKKPGNNGDDLSNSWPFDPDLNQFPQPFTYCTGKVSSNGFAPIIGWSGQPSFSAQNFSLNVNTLLSFKNGLFFEGIGQATIPFLGATLCTNPPLARNPIILTDEFGFFQMPLSLDLDDIGLTRNFQTWLRDPQNPDGTGTTLSNAAEIFITP